MCVNSNSYTISENDILAVLALKQQVREYDFFDLIDVDIFAVVVLDQGVREFDLLELIKD